MASTSSTNSTSQYTYQRPSTLATRTLVSDPKPGEIPSTTSNDANASDDRKNPAHSSASDNYSQAVAAAKSSSQSDRPGLDRQQSWNMSDKKRQMAEQMLQGSQGHNVQGYASTTSSATQ